MKKQRLNQMASWLCKREGKKSQISVGDMREVLSILEREFYLRDEDERMLEIKRQETIINAQLAKFIKEASGLKVAPRKKK